MPSLILKKPVMVAWATPGSAVLTGELAGCGLQAFASAQTALALAGGVAWAGAGDRVGWAAVSLELATSAFTMATQNLPGVAVMRATGFHMPVSGLITMTGMATLVLVPFGASALNVSAITAAAW